MFAEFEDLLKQTMGLDAASVGAAAIERAVQQRLAACGLRDADAYLERVLASTDERQELIEAVHPCPRRGFSAIARRSRRSRGWFTKSGCQRTRPACCTC